MTKPGQSIVLMGLRGSGKTTVGRLLAERLGVRFIDLDDVTPGLLGCAGVAEAWAEHGEAGFRRAEAAALRSVVERERGAVIALGGGTPTAPGAQEVIESARRAAGVRVVYLREAPATLRARLKQGGAGRDRPSLTGADPLEEIEAVFAARDALYRGLADLVLEGTTRAEAASEALTKWIGE